MAATRRVCGPAMRWRGRRWTPRRQAEARWTSPTGRVIGGGGRARVVAHREQRRERLPAEPVTIDVDRGERGPSEGGHLDVVEAHDGDVGGDAPPGVGEEAERRHGHQVVVGENAVHVGREGEDLTHRLAAAVGGRGTTNDHRLVVDVGLVPALAQLRERRVAGEHGDPAAPRAAKVAGREGGAGLDVGADRAHVGTGRLVVDDHGGHPALGGEADRSMDGAGGGEEDHPVDRVGAHRVEHLVLPVDVAAGAREEHGQPDFAGCGLDALRHVREEGVGHVGRDETDRGAAAADQAAGEQVRLVAELANGIEDPFAGRLAEAGFVVDHPGDGATGHTDGSRDVVQCRFASCRCHVAPFVFARRDRFPGNPVGAAASTMTRVGRPRSASTLASTLT